MESLPVPSVQALVAATGGADVPPRYLRPEAAADAVAGDGEAEIPVIDFQRLLIDSHEECARLHGACQEWGFFQLINHGIPHDVIEGMKANVEGFFRLPAETKKQFAKERGEVDGYGQLFVFSEDQKLDWADQLALYTQPPQARKMRFWPDKAANLRWTLDKYSTAVKNVADGLLGIMSKNLGLEDLHEREVQEYRAPGHDRHGERAAVRCCIPLSQRPCHHRSSQGGDGAWRRGAV